MIMIVDKWLHSLKRYKATKILPTPTTKSNFYEPRSAFFLEQITKVWNAWKIWIINGQGKSQNGQVWNLPEIFLTYSHVIHKYWTITWILVNAVYEELNQYILKTSWP